MDKVCSTYCLHCGELEFGLTYSKVFKLFNNPVVHYILLKMLLHYTACPYAVEL